MRKGRRSGGWFQTKAHPVKSACHPNSKIGVRLVYPAFKKR